jgi:flagellar protein FlaG
MKIDHAQALTAQSFSFVGKDAALTAAKSAQSTQVDEQAKIAATEAAVEEKTSQTKQMTQESTQMMVEKMNDVIKANGSEMQFQMDQDAGRMVLYLKDAKTGETLRQIPDKEALRISQQIDDYLEGLKTQNPKEDAVGKLSGLMTDVKA